MPSLESTQFEDGACVWEILEELGNTVIVHGVELAAILGALDQKLRDPRLPTFELMGDI